jgi:hypothetical protein
MAFISWREYSGKKGITYRCHLRHSYLEGGVKKERAKYLGCIAQTPSRLEASLSNARQVQEETQQTYHQLDN